MYEKEEEEGDDLVGSAFVMFVAIPAIFSYPPFPCVVGGHASCRRV